MTGKLDLRSIDVGGVEIDDRNLAYHLLAGLTDREALDALIAAVPDGESAELYVPYRSVPYSLGAGYLQYGSRNVTWVIDYGVTLTGSTDWAKFNAPIIMARGTHMPGMVGYGQVDTGRILTVGGGGALNGRNGVFSGYASLTDLVLAHERGMGGDSASISDDTSVDIPSATFTLTSFTPATAIDTNTLRVGMVVDVPGTTYYASSATVRYTSRITGWETDGSVIYVENWYRPDAGFTTAIKEAPPNGRAVAINRPNKMWVKSANLYFNRTNGASFGHVSGSFAEVNVFNESGADLEAYFNADTHPAHVYLFDANHAGTYGGGVAFNVRGKKWSTGFRSSGSAIGYHYDATSINNGGQAIVVDNDGDCSVSDAMMVREDIAGSWSRIARLAGAAPEFDLGRQSVASTPKLNLHSSGNDNTYDAQIYASGGTGSDGAGTLGFRAGQYKFNSIPVAADDAAAATAGVPVDGMYRTAAGDARIRVS